ncbi:MAG: hypothetical protein KME01_11310 [Chroococcus sp. CMT-3BRIN-NPC107]|nr:hypothetical protein [Chroococcus sp. CMT-3BRIN-NPC107]
MYLQLIYVMYAIANSYIFYQFESGWYLGSRIVATTLDNKENLRRNCRCLEVSFLMKPQSNLPAFKPFWGSAGSSNTL